VGRPESFLVFPLKYRMAYNHVFALTLTVDMLFVIIHAGGLNGKHVRSGRAVEEGAGAGTQGTRTDRLGLGSARHQLEAHDLCSEPEEDGRSTETTVGEGEGRRVKDACGSV
jgi:hypothetical protein